MEVSIQLPSDPTSASAARSFVADTLETWGVGTYVLQRAVLLTSEVVTNAIVHARSPLTLVVTSTPATVRIGVRDGSRQLPRQSGGDELNRGRGLLLVEALADRWGTAPEGHGKTVWFELASGHDDDLSGAPLAD